MLNAVNMRTISFTSISNAEHKRLMKSSNKAELENAVFSPKNTPLGSIENPEDAKAYSELVEKLANMQPDGALKAKTYTMGGFMLVRAAKDNPGKMNKKALDVFLYNAEDLLFKAMQELV